MTTLVTAAHLGAPPAHAQDDDDAAATPTVDPLKADFKGMVGVGLIGMELGFVIPAVAGAKGAWPYIVFPVLGAGGGAAAGYFLLEKDGGEPEIAVASLMAGMALLVPAMVITISETAYDPEDDVANARRLADAGPGLVRYAADGSVLLAPPAISTERTSDRREERLAGQPMTSEIRVELLSGRF